MRFRPLAGFWFLNAATTNSMLRAYSRFRPLAGFWFLNSYGKELEADVNTVPSPCGGSLS